MAIADKLTKLETDISNAYDTIETKGGTLPTDKNTNNLSTAIDSIPTGGQPTQEGDFRVRFYDCDGTLLKEEWVNQGEDATPPVTPNYDPDRLTFRGWNHSYTNIQGNTSTGALYTVNDHAIYYFITLNPFVSKTISFTYNAATAGTIDWGDGETTEISSGSSISVSHTYNQSGNYIIKINNTSDYSDNIINNSSSNVSPLLQKVYIGNQYIQTGGNYFYTSLASAGPLFYVFDSNVKAYNNTTGSGIRGSRLNIIILNDNETEFKANSIFDNLSNSYSNKNILVLNDNVISSIGSQGGTSGSAFKFYLSEVDNLYQITQISSGGAFNNSRIKYLNLKSLTSIYANSNCFRYCYNLKEVYFESLTSFPNGENIFSDCYELEAMILNKSTMIPLNSSTSLAAIKKITNILIYVPDSLYTTYINNTYWSVFAGVIKKMSELPTTSHFYAYVKNN